MKTLNKFIAGLQLKRRSIFKNEIVQRNKKQISKNSDLLLLLMNNKKENDFLFI